MHKKPAFVHLFLMIGEGLGMRLGITYSNRLSVLYMCMIMRANCTRLCTNYGYVLLRIIEE